MSSDTEELPPGVEPSPALSREDIAALKAEVIERQKRIAAEQAAVEEADERDWFADLAAKGQREVAAWAALPCLGQLESVGKCTDLCQSSCERSQHVMCPRLQLGRAIAEAKNKSNLARAEGLRRGVPKKAIDALGAPVETQAMQLLRSAFEIAPVPTFVVLLGGVGCGKTCAAASWAIDQGARFLTAAEFGRLSPYGEDAKAVTEARRLVVDDLGAEYLDPKGHFLSNLDALIDHRYEHVLQTVITTNLDLAAFKARYGVRISDRLRETCVFKSVGGPSMRRRA